MRASAPTYDSSIATASGGAARRGRRRLEDRLQPQLRPLAGPRLPPPELERAQPAVARLDDAVPARGRAGVDPENPHAPKVRTQPDVPFPSHWRHASSRTPAPRRRASRRLRRLLRPELVETTAAKLGAIHSGKIRLALLVTPQGAGGQQVGFEVDGPVALPTGGRLPEARLRYTQVIGPRRASLTLISKGAQGFLRVGGKTYELEPGQVEQLRSVAGALAAAGGLSHARPEELDRRPARDALRRPRPRRGRRLRRGRPERGQRVRRPADARPCGRAGGAAARGRRRRPAPRLGALRDRPPRHRPRRTGCCARSSSTCASDGRSPSRSAICSAASPAARSTSRSTSPTPTGR